MYYIGQLSNFTRICRLSHLLATLWAPTRSGGVRVEAGGLEKNGKSRSGSLFGISQTETTIITSPYMGVTTKKLCGYSKPV